MKRLNNKTLTFIFAAAIITFTVVNHVYAQGGAGSGPSQPGAVMGSGPGGASGPGGMPGGSGGAPGQGGGNMVDNSKLNFHPAFDEMDKNKDGKVNKEEFMAGGFDDDAYDKLFQKMLNKNGDEFLTFEEFTSSFPQFEVDTNHDGKVSLKEFLGNNTKAAEDKGLRLKAGAASGGAASTTK